MQGLSLVRDQCLDHGLGASQVWIRRVNEKDRLAEMPPVVLMHLDLLKVHLVALDYWQGGLVRL